MEHDILVGALVRLPERLKAFDKRIGRYCGHISSGKGITIKTPTASLFLYHSFIYKFLNHPESVTEEDLKKVASNIK